jgi:UDP-galactopyranose mutase
VDVICLSHLRWDFVYQRPQHLLSRCARDRRVYFFEEPIFDADRAYLMIEKDGVHRVVPHLPRTWTQPVELELRLLVDQLVAEQNIESFVLWYYTPMAMAFTYHMGADLVIYDCMDELSAFKGAAADMRRREDELLMCADLVFTGGASLFDAKRDKHPDVHLFPSSVDVAHFARAREPQADPPSQAGIPHPRVGYFGVIDERMDLGLLAALADARPDLQLVMVGPVVKIDPASLPQRPNLHWLGGRMYADLPAYIAGWDVAMLPCARNRSTLFISPTKTPEYLAAGRPVVSTPVRDVVRSYGATGLAHIAEDAAGFSAAIDRALAEDPIARQRRADACLADMSWDRTWASMWALIERALGRRKARSADLRLLAGGGQ